MMSRISACSLAIEVSLTREGWKTDSSVATEFSNFLRIRSQLNRNAIRGAIARYPLPIDLAAIGEVAGSADHRDCLSCPGDPDHRNPLFRKPVEHVEG